MIDEEIYTLELTKVELAYLYRFLQTEGEKIADISEDYNNDLELMKKNMSFKDYTNLVDTYNLNEAIGKKIHFIIGYKGKKSDI